MSDTLQPWRHSDVSAVLSLLLAKNPAARREPGRRRNARHSRSVVLHRLFHGVPLKFAARPACLPRRKSRVRLSARRVWVAAATKTLPRRQAAPLENCLARYLRAPAVDTPSVLPVRPKRHRAHAQRTVLALQAAKNWRCLRSPSLCLAPMIRNAELLVLSMLFFASLA